MSRLGRGWGELDGGWGELDGGWGTGAEDGLPGVELFECTIASNHPIGWFCFWPPFAIFVPFSRNQKSRFQETKKAVVEKSKTPFLKCCLQEAEKEELSWP